MTKLLPLTSLALIAAMFQPGTSHGQILPVQSEALPPPAMVQPPGPAQPSGDPAQKAVSPAQKAVSPAQKTVSPAQKTVSPAQKSVGPAQKGTKGVYQPDIVYRSHPLHRKRYLVCQPVQDVVLEVEDPVSCCVATIPVCLPVCCDTPYVSAKVVLRRGVVCCDWDCGVRVKIVFRAKGDVLVHYYGI